MAGIVRCQLEDAVVSLFERNADKGTRVKSNAPIVNKAENLIEQLAMRTLEHQNSETKLIRPVFGIIRFAGHLARIGDHASLIAKESITLQQMPENPSNHFIEPLFDAVLELLILATEARVDDNLLLARNLTTKETQLDLQHSRCALKLVSMAEQKQVNQSAVLSLILILRALERVGQLSLALGEDLVFGLSPSSPNLNQALEQTHMLRSGNNLPNSLANRIGEMIG